MDLRHHLDCAQCGIRERCVGSGITAPPNDETIKENRVYFRGEKMMVGDEADGVFLVRSGLLRVLRRLPSGNAVTIDLVSSGDMLLAPSLFTMKDPSRLVDVIDTSEVCFISGERFRNWLKSSSQARDRLVRWAGHEYLRREEQICSLSYRSVRERTAEALVYLAERFGSNHPEGTGVPGSLTREDIAALIGTARESVVRQLAEFKDEGCIALDGRQIVVKRMDSLKRIAKVDPNVPLAKPI